ncbi:MAG: DUF3990 domain-containing protein [Oscillospiraceae bacterium]|nr:DUF3990 domain-containing protein [Oscillospiraceae bacterium]
MILYHGTTMRIEKPRIIQSEVGRDFGFAFYTTDIRAQAERWAVRRAKIETRREKNPCDAVVNIYDWARDRNDLLYLAFPEPSMDWLEMVMRCRSDIGYQHGYDIVEGKIANDNVGETVSYVMQGIMRKDDAVERLRFEKINNQIAFCSERALESLLFIDSYVVKR